MSRLLAPMLVALLLQACAAAPAAKSSPATAGAKAMHPTPYTAEQIRDASHAGRRLEYRFEQLGQAPKRMVMRFLSVTADEAEIETTLTDLDGTAGSKPEVARAKWADLRRHAEFPAGSVKVSPGTAPYRQTECDVYSVDKGGGVTGTYYFARDPAMAGPPLLFQISKDGQPTLTSTLEAYDPGAPAAPTAAGAPSP